MNPRPAHQFTVDCIGDWKSPEKLKAISEAHGARIEYRFSSSVDEVRYSRYLVSPLEEAGDSDRGFSISPWRESVFAEASRQNVDVVIRNRFSPPEGPFQPIKLLVLDVDSTFIQNEMIDELARERGVYEEIREITERAMLGELDFRQSLTLRASKLVGLRTEDLDAALSRIRLSKGAEALIAGAKKQGCRTALISGGFHFVVDVLQERLGVDVVYANDLEMPGGVFTGKISGELLDAERKAELLQETARKFGVPLNQVLAVGDGANDVKMLKRAGLGIGFQPKPVLWNFVDGVISSGDLRSILPVLAGG